jgi:uncharacterized protein YcaQ
VLVEAGLPGLPKPRERLSAAQARRIALAASGFGEPRPAAAGPRDVARVLRRLGLVQIDSVNVLVRAHYVPLFSRLGPYDRALLDAAAHDRRRRSLFEYWGHEASLVRLDLHPALRWRMRRAERGEGSTAALPASPPSGVPSSRRLREIEAQGPLTARELSEGGKGRGSWWGWSDGKRALEWLFWAGRVAAAGRRGFERVYDLPERVLPATVLGQPAPPDDEAQRTLLTVAARALGVATERDLRDYFRLDPAEARARVAELVEAGTLLPVDVEGWGAPAFLDPAARFPRRIEARALVSPFDPLVWERARTERIFSFRYRIEIYTPADKREHGYYSLPFLLGDRLVARVDLKADRAGRRLLVRSVSLEPWADRGAVAPALDAELRAAADWLGLESVVAEPAASPAL